MILLISATRGTGSGAERVLCHLLGAWPDPARSFAIMAPARSLLLRRAAELGVAAVPLAGRDTLLGNWAAVRSVERRAPPCHLVHAWSAQSFELAAYVANERGVPHAATLHDHPAATYFNGLRRVLMRLGTARAAAIACVSESVRAACIAARYRCPLVVIRNGLPRRVTGAPGTRASAPLVRVGFLGMSAIDKGFSIVKDWIRRLPSPPAVRWHLYGRIEAALRAEAEALQAAAGGSVCLRGHAPSDQIMQEVDVIVHPSLVFDAFPTVLLEAARAGIPVIASDVGGTREIVEPGVTGLLYDPQRPDDGLRGLERLVADEPLRRALGQAASARFGRSFGVEAMVEGYRAFWPGLRSASP